MHPQTLRQYERRGLLNPARTQGGNRRYSDDDIEVLRRVAELAAEGMNLEGIRRVMQLEAENARLRDELAAAQGPGAQRPDRGRAPPAPRPRAAAPGRRRVRRSPRVPADKPQQTLIIDDSPSSARSTLRPQRPNVRWPSTSPTHLRRPPGAARSIPTAKRIRAFVGGEPIIDSTRALIVWEPRRIVPSYAVPVADIAAPLTPAAADATAEEHAVQVGDLPPVLDPRTGFAFHTVDGQSFDIAATTGALANAAFVADDPDLDGYAIIDFDAFDEWREEDELLVAHARDPFGTVDTRRSSRRVVVEIAGTTVADSTRSVMLFETYLPTRYYLPREDVRMDLLEPTDTRRRVPTRALPRTGRHVSTARWSRDVAWSYEDPHNFATAVQGHDLLLQRTRRHQRRRRLASSARAPRGRRTSAGRRGG